MENRNKFAFHNIFSGFLLQGVLSVSGILLPHFFLIAYGSGMNGMISSVGQFLTYLALVEAGIAAAASVELYRPLALQDEEGRNAVLSSARSFYLRSGILYAGLLAVLVIVYPFFVKNQIPAGMTRLMILILAAGNLCDYLFLGKYRILLTADQKMYVINMVRIVETILNMILTLGLIRTGFSALCVKMVTTALYILRGIVCAVYVRNKYSNLSFSDTGHKKVHLGQRWYALVHQIAGVIVSSTDMIILTVCCGANSLLEVSIYSIYNLIGYSLTSFLNVFSNSLTSGFGSLIAVDHPDRLKEAYSNYEYLYDMLLFFCYGMMALLILPFVSLYTRGIKDVEYIRIDVAVLFVIAGFLQNLRQPGLTVICAAGHYKETTGRAVIEAVINLLVSLLLVGRFGILGVLVGTICSYIYRTTDTILYSAKHIISGTVFLSLRRIFRNLLATMAAGSLLYYWMRVEITGWISWFGCAVFYGIVLLAAIFSVNLIVEYDQMRQLTGRIKRAMYRK